MMNSFGIRWTCQIKSRMCRFGTFHGGDLVPHDRLKLTLRGSTRRQTVWFHPRWTPNSIVSFSSRFGSFRIASCCKPNMWMCALLSWGLGRLQSRSEHSIPSFWGRSNWQGGLGVHHCSQLNILIILVIIFQWVTAKFNSKISPRLSDI